MSQECFSAMRQTIIDGAPETAAELARQALAAGIAPLEAVNGGYVAMHAVGQQFAKGQMFLPDMMAAAEAMRAAMAVLDPELKRLGGERPVAGTVILGTAKGDIHEIGKSLVGTLLSANGFRVYDLGVDVPGEKFAAKAQEVGADIVGVSALLTTTMCHQKAVIEALEKFELRSRVKVMLGGAPVTRRWAEEIGADGYAKDAMRALELARNLMALSRQLTFGGRVAVRPKLELLERSLVERIIGEAFQLLQNPGVRVAPYVFELLASAGARIENGIAHIPEQLARKALASTPHEFFLYPRSGPPAVHYGGDNVHFDPGSSCLNILDAATQQPRPAQSADLVRLVQVAERLPQYAAQSTAIVCNDVPPEMGDWFRLLLVLCYSGKPVVTGAFSGPSLETMVALLVEDSGGQAALRERPRAIFDVCPSPPLNWSEFASHNIADRARAGVPAEIVSMPLAGATAPATLAGAVVQHTAECLSGITIHQLAAPGAPIVWGGAPAIFDMRTGTTAVGAIETAMLDMARKLASTLPCPRTDISWRAMPRCSMPRREWKAACRRFWVCWRGST